jgi:hypothetical protein
VSATDKKPSHAPRSRAPRKVDLASLKKAATEKCNNPAALMARHGHQGEFVPVCEEHAEAAIERSASAGKKRSRKGRKSTRRRLFLRKQSRRRAAAPPPSTHRG